MGLYGFVCGAGDSVCWWWSNDAAPQISHIVYEENEDGESEPVFYAEKMRVPLALCENVSSYVEQDRVLTEVLLAQFRRNPDYDPLWEPKFLENLKKLGIDSNRVAVTRIPLIDKK